MICADDCLSARDLGAMRLTNKELHTITTKEFAQRFFRNPYVMMLQDSLEALVEICKHSVFGTHVRKVQLLNNFFDPDSLQSLAREIGGTYGGTDNMRLLRRSSRLQCLADLIVEQHDLVNTGTGLRLLKRAFEALGAQGRSVAIVSQKLNLSYPPLGWSNIARNFRQDQIYSLLGKPRVSSTTKILLEAAQAGACKVSKLEVELNRLHNSARELFGLGNLDRSLLLGLVEINFRYNCQVRYPYDISLADQYLVPLIRAVPPDLKTLAVSSDAIDPRIQAGSHTMYHALTPGLRPGAFTAMHPNALETLSLSKMSLHQDDLLQLLNAFASSVKKLDLDEIYLCGNWDHVLSHVARSFSLKHFKLRKAHNIVDDPRSRWRTFSAKVITWYPRDCEFLDEHNMRQNFAVFLETERQAKEAKQRRPVRKEDLRRSARIAKNNTSGV